MLSHSFPRLGCNSFSFSPNCRSIFGLSFYYDGYSFLNKDNTNVRFPNLEICDRKLYYSVLDNV